MPEQSAAERLISAMRAESDDQSEAESEDSIMPEETDTTIEYQAENDDEWNEMEDENVPPEDGWTDPDRVYIGYSNSSAGTAPRLASYLGVRYGRPGRMGSPRPDTLVRWGSSAGATYYPGEGTLNGMREVEQNTDKLRSLQMMESYGVPVPAYSDSLEGLLEQEDVSYPVMGRASNHSQGRDINLILQERDDYLTDNDFYTEYIPTEYEYRVHVFQGEVVKVHQKLLRSEADNHPFIRNYETGWVFANQRDDVNLQPAINAVDAMGLDFGAVDLVKGEDGNAYVLEVNTAPSLDERNLERWAEYFIDALDLDPDRVPGMEAVREEYPYEDDEEESHGVAEDEDYIQV